MDNDIRTSINFFSAGLSVRTVELCWTLPNVTVGQWISFDHPQLRKCIGGEVMNINHVVFLDPKTKPVTYIDVKMDI